MSFPSQDYSAPRRVNDLPLSMYTYICICMREIRRRGRSVCRRRRSRMMSFLLIAGVGGRARGLPLDSYVRHAIPRDSNCMPTRSNNFALETTRKREEDDDVADVGWMAGEESRNGTRCHI